MEKKKKSLKKNSKKFISILLLVFAIVIFLNVLNRVFVMFSLKNQAKLVEEQLNALKEENASLTSMKEKLEDPEYIQTYARGEYMFSKGDEKVFFLPGGN